MMNVRTAVVAAHPDDEVLWFSSLAANVERIVLCFVGIEGTPAVTEGRRRSLEEYPLSSLRSLGLNESETFLGADWNDPVVTRFGLEILTKEKARRYRDNYYRLRYLLRERLAGFADVVTHNPWGEYGHPEHVQVYRVVKELQEPLGYTLWFSNYCSNKSLPLALRYVSGFTSSYVTLTTDKDIGRHLGDIYKRNGCWTWYDDWEWFNEESFMRDVIRADVKPYGHFFPLNMIKMNIPASPAVGAVRRAGRSGYLRAVKRLAERL